jgi:hypothetical protein
MLKLRPPEAAAAGDFLSVPCPFGLMKEFDVVSQECTVFGDCLCCLRVGVFSIKT